MAMEGPSRASAVPVVAPGCALEGPGSEAGQTGRGSCGILFGSLGRTSAQVGLPFPPILEK